MKVTSSQAISTATRREGRHVMADDLAAFGSTRGGPRRQHLPRFPQALSLSATAVPSRPLGQVHR